MYSKFIIIISLGLISCNSYAHSCHQLLSKLIPVQQLMQKLSNTSSSETLLLRRVEAFKARNRWFFQHDISPIQIVMADQYGLQAHFHPRTRKLFLHPNGVIENGGELSVQAAMPFNFHEFIHVYFMENLLDHVSDALKKDLVLVMQFNELLTKKDRMPYNSAVLEELGQLGRTVTQFGDKLNNFIPAYDHLVKPYEELFADLMVANDYRDTEVISDLIYEIHAAFPEARSFGHKYRIDPELLATEVYFDSSPHSYFVLVRKYLAQKYAGQINSTGIEQGELREIFNALAQNVEENLHRLYQDEDGLLDPLEQSQSFIRALESVHAR